VNRGDDRVVHASGIHLAPYDQRQSNDDRLAFIVIKRISSLILAAMLLGSHHAHATTQSLEAVQSAAEAFVRGQLPAATSKHYISAASLDPRLRLAACESPLEAFSQSAGAAGARMTVGVRCAAANPWTLYVPVSIEVEAPVLVLKRALARRARIAPSDVEPQTRRLPGSAAHFVSDIASLQGHRLKRSLPAGAAVTVDALTPDILVRRGQHVTLIAATGPVEIRAQGLALADAAESERVRVQNATSLKVVEGVVDRNGVVHVGL
jgi:flagellar basal body P-ring formation protein FlgA